MKRMLDRHAERMRPEEWRRFREALRLRLSRPEADVRPTARRWALSFSVAAVAAVLAGLLIMRTDLGREALARRGLRLLGFGTPTVPAGPAGARQLREGAAIPEREEAYGFPVAPAAAADRFTRAEEDSISSFALDCTDASYRETRRLILAGELPDPGDVRVEEFLRFFHQGYPQFDQPAVRVFLDGAPSPFNPETELLRIGVRTSGPDSTASVRPIQGTWPKAGGGANPEGDPGDRGFAARDARLEVRFHPNMVERFRLLGYEAAPEAGAGEAGAERAQRIPGADLRAGVEAVALYEVKLRGPLIPGQVATVTLRYTGADARPSTIVESIQASDLAPDFARAAPRLRLDAVTARFAAILRASGGWNGDRLMTLLPLARELAVEMPGDPAVAELADLVRRSADLADRAVRDPGVRQIPSTSGARTSS